MIELRKRGIKYLTFCVSIFVIFFYFRNDIKDFLFGRDYTYNFNPQREKLKIPELPKEWRPIFPNRKKYETEYWENNILDSINPTHSQKQVIVESGDLYLEVDQYTNIKLRQRLDIEYYFKNDKWKFIFYDNAKLEKLELSESEVREILSSWRLIHPKFGSVSK